MYITKRVKGVHLLLDECLLYYYCEKLWQLNAVAYSVTGHRRTWATCLACSVSWFSSVIVNLTQWHQKVGHSKSRIRVVLPRFCRKMDENGAHQGPCSPFQMALTALVRLRWKWSFLSPSQNDLSEEFKRGDSARLLLVGSCAEWAKLL